MKPKKVILFIITIFFLTGCSQTPFDVCGGGKIFTNYRGSKEAGWVLTNGKDYVQDVKTERRFDSPVISPDGKKVMYRDLVKNINVLDLQTKVVEPLIVDLNSTAIVAAWSPDSKKALISYGNELEFSVYIVDIEQKIPHLLSAKNTYEFSQDWSKDGQYIVYTQTDQLYDSTLDDFVLIEHPDGTGRKVVLHDSQIGRVKFLPNAQSIFIVSSSKVYLFDWKRNEKIELPGLPKGAHSYALSPNGKCIAYMPEATKDLTTEIPIYVLESGNIFTIPVPGHHYDGLTWGK